MSTSPRVVYVTGAASGMGRLAAQRMAAAGAVVAAVDIDEDGLRETARASDRIRPFVLDVTDTAAIADHVRDVELEHGPVDRAYAAAAILRTELIAEQDTETILRVMDIGYRGVVNVTKAVLPGMLERRRGDLIVFASIAGWAPAMYTDAYCAMKAAVVSFTEVLAHENHGSGLRILCVCPAQVATPMIDAPGTVPRLLRHRSLPAITPGEVLDAIERDLDRGRLFCFPNLRTRLAWWTRRHAPALLWKFAHREEGF